MPALVCARAHWDPDTAKVRYYAQFESSDAWIEIPGEDFDRLTRLFAQEAIDMCCCTITETIDDVRETLGEFAAFREGLEKLTGMTKPSPEGGN
jgi:hypothetical protein